MKNLSLETHRLAIGIIIIRYNETIIL